MPYDSAKVRDLLRVASQHRNMPNGEYVSSLAEQLSDAESALAIQAVTVRKAHEETSAVQTRLDAIVEAERKLRESTQGHAQMIETLRAIAKSPKGAQKLALETLTAAGLGEQPKV